MLTCGKLNLVYKKNINTAHTYNKKRFKKNVYEKIKITLSPRRLHTKSR